MIRWLVGLLVGVFCFIDGLFGCLVDLFGCWIAVVNLVDLIRLTPRPFQPDTLGECSTSLAKSAGGLGLLPAGTPFRIGRICHGVTWMFNPFGRLDVQHIRFLRLSAFKILVGFAVVGFPLKRNLGLCLGDRKAVRVSGQ